MPGMPGQQQQQQQLDCELGAGEATEPHSGALAPGRGGEGQHQWDFCVAGAKEHMAKARSPVQIHLFLSVLQ